MGGIRTTLVLAVLGCLLPLAGPTASAAGATNHNAAGDTTPPTVTLRVPASAAGVVSLQAAATDTNRVVTTEIFVDDVRVATSTTAQASVRWNTTSTANGPQVSNAIGIPERARWEAQMVAYGRRACDWLQTPGLTLDERLAHVYYDQIRVMYQLADYTEDPSWNACAAQAATVYRDLYVLPNGGAVPGYWNFTTGLREDVERTGNPASRTAVVQLSQSAMYAADYTPLEWTQDTGRSREVAYAILSYIDAQALGEPARPRRRALVDQAYGHLDQWFVWYTWRNAPQQFSPFIVGLTAHSLIRDWEQTHRCPSRPGVAPRRRLVVEACLGSRGRGDGVRREWRGRPGARGPGPQPVDRPHVRVPLLADGTNSLSG